MKLFKIRCSAIGQIMGRVELTDAQLKAMDTLQSKDVPLTVKQADTLEELTYKHENPELPKTAKTFLQNWVKEQIYDRRNEFSNKYVDKGIAVENNSIDFIGEQLDLGFVIKNKEQFEDDFKTGEPDVLLADVVIDAKNSFDCFTFPLYEEEIPTEGYAWQLQGYMGLTGKKSAKLVYTLMDTPKHIIEKEFKWNNRHELDYEDFEKQYLYEHIDPKYRIKVYDVARDDEKIKAIDERVMLCRKYIETLL